MRRKTEALRRAETTAKSEWRLFISCSLRPTRMKWATTSARCRGDESFRSTSSTVQKITCSPIIHSFVNNVEAVVDRRSWKEHHFFLETQLRSPIRFSKLG